MRYAGQGHELDVAAFETRRWADASAARFAALHEQRYGFTLDRRPR